MPKKKEAPLTLPKVEIVTMSNSDNADPIVVESGTTDVMAEVNLDEFEIHKPAGRIIAIVGFAETSRDQVKAEPDTTEIWSLNRCYTFLLNLFNQPIKVFVEIGILRVDTSNSSQVRG